jgi:hypothetical protein
MKLGIPSEVTEAFRKLEKVRAAKERQEQRAIEAESRRLAAIDALRQARWTESEGHAAAVFAWYKAFLELPQSQSIIAHVGGSLTVFVGKFWRGEPVPPTDVSSRAMLTMRRYGLWYDEWYKGNCSHELRLFSEDHMIRFVHPDFLKQVAEHLAGPDAWKYIQAALEQKVKLVTMTA